MSDASPAVTRARFTLSLSSMTASVKIDSSVAPWSRVWISS